MLGKIKRGSAMPKNRKVSLLTKALENGYEWEQME